jgi:hypothetical protein
LDNNWITNFIYLFKEIKRDYNKMTEYSCSICKYTSNLKEHVVRHINRKKSCGFGVKEIIEVSIEIKCELCNKKFSCSTSLRYHIKNTCKHKDDAKDVRIKQLEKELNESRKVTINNNNNNNSTNININIIVNNYEDTSLDKLTDKMYNKIIKGAEEVYKIIPRLIKNIHFNPNIRENHNIYLSNRGKNNKYIQVYRNGHWEIENKSMEIDNLINDKETNLSDWVAEKGEKYPEAMERFNEYLEQKYDNDIIKLVKEEVEQVLYNNKHMIKT